VPKKLDLPIEKKTLNLFLGDAAILDRFYPIGWSVVVRQLVHIHARKLLERASREGVLANEQRDIEQLAASINVGELAAAIASDPESPDDGGPEPGDLLGGPDPADY
jgi:hypothetical protein